MAAHCMKVSDDIITRYEDMRDKKNDHYLIMSINRTKTGQTEIELLDDKCATIAEGKTHDDFLAQFPEKECRYAMLNFKHKVRHRRPV
jgi:hypothetical protein